MSQRRGRGRTTSSPTEKFLRHAWDQGKLTIYEAEYKIETGLIALYFENLQYFGSWELLRGETSLRFDYQPRHLYFADVPGEGCIAI